MGAWRPRSMSDLCAAWGRRRGERVLVLFGCIGRMGKRDSESSVGVSYVVRGCLIVSLAYPQVSTS